MGKEYTKICLFVDNIQKQLDSIVIIPFNTTVRVSIQNVLFKSFQNHYQINHSFIHKPINKNLLKSTKQKIVFIYIRIIPSHQKHVIKSEINKMHFQMKFFHQLILKSILSVILLPNILTNI